MPEPVTDAEDEELVRRIRAGDKAASAILYGRHEALLRRRAGRVVGSLRRKLGASDVVQETYLAAFTGLDSFEDQGPGSFRRWLEAILTHKAADQVKRHLREGRDARRETSPSPDAAGAGPEGVEPTPSVVAMREEEHAALRRAIDSMTGDDRTVLALVHEQGKDFAQAGLAMGRSAEAVRKLYGRAALRLGREMNRPS